MYELVIRAPQARVEAMCDALMDELAALSVSVEDADAGSQGEVPMFGEPGLPAPREAWEHSTLQALFEDEPAATRAAAALLAQPWAGELRLQALGPVEQADWVRLTQSQFAPVPITPEFWIVPTWHEVPPAAQQVIRLDPGLAFGTGTHPTTRMCLRWIAGQGPHMPQARVLDYGCGSGILAIAACLHGAAKVLAVDIDPAAVQATRANAQANGVALAAAEPSSATGRFDLILANILATPLKLLAPLLCGHLAPRAQLVLAGILQRQRDELAAAYAPWVKLAVADEEDGWVLMTATRSGT